MLVGEKHHATCAGECPVEGRFGIARRADNSAVPADKSFETRGRVDVRDRRDVVGVEHFAQLIPGIFDLLDCRHVGHGTAGCQVGQNHADPLAVALGQFFRSIGQDIGGLGHEVHATKRDVTALGAVSGRLAELIAITAQVDQVDHLVLLVVVPQNEQLRPQRSAHGLDASRQGVVFQRFVLPQVELGRGGGGGHGFGLGGI